MSKQKVISRFTSVFNAPFKILFNSPKISSYVYFMSIISGYPVGAKIIADLEENKLINSCESTKLCTFCSTSGPLFIIGSIGTTMLHNKNLGLILYLTHILSGILTGIVFRNFFISSSKNAVILEKKANIDNILGDAVYSSVVNILVVGGYITIFYIFADILFDFNILLPLKLIISFLFSPFTSDDNIISGITIGLIESTKGSSLLTKISSPLTLPSISFILAFGGISIIMQQICYLKKAKANIKIFLFSKMIHAILSFFVCLILCHFFIS